MKFLLLFLASCLLLFASPNQLWAQSTITPTVYLVKEKKESLESIAIKLLPRFKNKYNKRIEDFKKDLKEWNPHITTWSELPLFSNIYVEYPYPVYISYPYAPKLDSGKSYNVLNSDAEVPSGSNKFTIFANYTASAGSFQEKVKDQQGYIKSTQNSPYSIGIGTTILLGGNSNMLSSSFYWSSLKASKLKGTDIEGVTNNQINVKPEYGFNLYFQHLSTWKQFSFYGGVDYEQFSTFNSNDYINGANLALNLNNLTYGTLGLGKTFFVGSFKILLKTSISQSIHSATTSKNGEIDLYKGQKIMLFTSAKGESNFTYHFMFKRHMLDGPTNLTINRFGLGVGFVIF